MTASAVRHLVINALRPLVGGLASIAVVLVLWIGFLALFHLDPLVAKSPPDVFRYLFDSPGSGDHRHSVLSGLGRTLTDAGVGFIAGLVAATVVAMIFILVRPVERALLPIAVTVRSVPLVAMTPLLTLIFGRGLLATTVISGIVVFFPALVTTTFGLRSTSKQAIDLCRAYGAGRWAVMRKVMLPSALPALFASARVAVPGALVGAMLAEWLATGQGLGWAMLRDSNTFDYDHLWAAVVVLTAFSVGCYYVIAAMESLALTRFGGTVRR
jgi:ABC-type nitrate/sulfonate/bicarbonate transport system permease component